jgi:ribosome recycling factor
MEINELENLIKEKKHKMAMAIESLQDSLTKIRTGRASPVMFDGVKVSAYGALSPLNEVANINIIDNMTISINVWDKNLIKDVQHAIEKANLGVVPMADASTVRINIPPLTEDRKKELVKVVKTYAEDAKIAIRNIRRDVMETLKKLQKSSSISEDVLNTKTKEFEEITKTFVEKVDSVILLKEKEILPNK